MKPISLTLKGFRGIRDGLGRDTLSLDFEQIAGDAQLVAIAGKNGRGKTTIMDNMTPYLLMPSRTGSDGWGGFSYYEHVYLPENFKELVWGHDGQRYRTQIVIRLTGKKKTEAYLHVQSETGWAPVALLDGTVSDGKVDTYGRCIESILGNAETFFTSVFSAQGRRPLSAYKNAEIKPLLADLLGLEEIRLIGAKASETVKHLKTGLAAVRQERGALQTEANQVATELNLLGEVSRRIDAALSQKRSCQKTLDEAKEALAQALASQALASLVASRRAQLQAEWQSIADSGNDALDTLERQSHREGERLTVLERRMAQRISSLARQREALVEQKNKLVALIGEGSHIARAHKRLPVSEKVAALREEEWQFRRRDAEMAIEFAANEKLVREKIAAIEREAGQAALAAQDLARRLGLTAEVPCSGTSMQGQCTLLKDAHTAKSLMPSAELKIAQLDKERRMLSAQLAEIQRHVAQYANAPVQLRRAEETYRRAVARAALQAQRAARMGEWQKALEEVAGLERQIADLALEDASVIEEEKAERIAFSDAIQQLAEQAEALKERQYESLARVKNALAELPAPFDGEIVRSAQAAVSKIQTALAEAESGYMAAVRDQYRAEDARHRQARLAQRLSQVDKRCAAIEQALGTWTLFAKCTSNDGVIALSIDDAGPTLSGLANDLLLACYGPRFTVSIKTLLETAKGESREGFDIVVHDAESGIAKSVTFMSGGERVWINECLVRAIALYLAQNAGRRYDTLFSDEADGPLDADRKRMFMTMKREVLRIGRYEREYFVSQTPELTAMADAVIDLDAFATQADNEASMTYHSVY